MVTEYPIGPGFQVAPNVWFTVTFGGSPGTYPPPNAAVWTVPAGVRSFTAQVVGGSTADQFGGAAYATSHRRFYNIPTEPGDEWLCEVSYSTIPGGTAAASPPYPAGPATLLYKRGEQPIIVAGGRGGFGLVPGSGFDVPDVPSDTDDPYVTSGGTAQPGANGTGSLGGGGGGGWGSAPASGGAAGLPGQNGTSLYPPSPLSSRPSPTEDEIGSWSPSVATIGLFWYLTAPSAGWVIDSTGF
jgi:hypothetical protein